MNTFAISPKDLPQQLVLWLLDTMDRATKQAYEIIWSMVKQLLVEYWVSVIVTLLLLLVFGTIRYFVTGRWGMLSIFYRLKITG